MKALTPPIIAKTLSVTSFAVITATISSLAITQPAQALSALSFSSTGFSSTLTTSTRGFAFNVLNPSGITVTDLSFFDENSDGLAESHDIGLWNSSGTLLASGTVSAGTTNALVGFFRTVDIADTFLAQGNGYVVGAVFLVGSSDKQAINFVGLTTPSDISYVGGRFINNGVASLTFPTSNLASGIPGGSFEFTPGATTPVPFDFNPNISLVLLGGGLVWRKLSRRKASRTV
ncbi:DUF4082 domain-containing protein [Anabaena azotica]|uniref:PFE-CTERM domain-containing protein n=1 Tax=Anabaena azotica TaxID=197653 RepID=UPI0039A58151